MLDETSLARFRDRGVLFVPGVFDAREVSSLKSAWAQLKAEIERGDGKVRREARFVLGEIPAPLGDLYEHPKLVELATDLLGPDVALYFLRILTKDEVWAGAVESHQDMPYFHGGYEKVAVFAPLNPLTVESGGLSFVAGSHHYKLIGRGTIDHTAFPGLSVETIEAQPGDVIAFDFHTWHFSGPKNTPGERTVIQIAYQPSSDGSYFIMPGRPVLVSGEWRTNRFYGFGESLTPDSVPPSPVPADLEASAQPASGSDLSVSGTGGEDIVGGHRGRFFGRMGRSRRP